jgi:hypothetical protein
MIWERSRKQTTKDERATTLQKRRPGIPEGNSGSRPTSLVQLGVRNRA